MAETKSTSETTIITKGAYGTIYKSSTTTRKKMKFNDYATRELYFGSRLNGPNIVQITGFAFKDKMIITEMPTYDADLETMISEKALDDTLRLKCVVNIAAALDFMHNRAVIHCDVKPGNILFAASTKSFHLADLGLTHKLSTDRLSQFIVTAPYRAPEVDIKGEPAVHDAAIDVWSFGCVCWEVYKGALLFETGDNRKSFVSLRFKPYELASLTVENVLDVLSPEWTGPKNILDIICRCTMPPSSRARMSDIMISLGETPADKVDNTPQTYSDHKVCNDIDASWIKLLTSREIDYAESLFRKVKGTSGFTKVSCMYIAASIHFGDSDGIYNAIGEKHRGKFREHVNNIFNDINGLI